MRKLLTIIFLLIASILLLPTAVNAANYYVLSTASGTGTGADWTNAYTVLPTNLTRGATYYIGDGTYIGHTFNDPCIGVCDETDRITIKKSTVADHGTDEGYVSTDHDGQALFQHPPPDTLAEKFAIWILASYYTIDGAVGSGSDISTYGFKVKLPSNFGDAENVSPYLSDYYGVNLAGTGHTSDIVTNIILKHIAAEGPGGGLACISGTPYSCSSSGFRGYSTNMDTVEIAYCYASGWINSITFKTGKNLIVHHNYFADNTGSNTGPHGQNTEIEAWTNVSFYDNIFVNSKTFVLAIHEDLNDGPIQYPPTTGLKFYNNLIIGSHATAYSAGIASMSGKTDVYYKAEIHHNTSVNVRFAGKGFVSQESLTDSGNKATVYNNLFYNCQYATMTDATVTHDYNAYLYTTTYTAETHPQIDAAAPTTIFTNYGAGNYTINASDQTAIDHIIGKGKTLASPFDIDMAGVTRTAPYDIGAYDVGGSADATAPTLAEVTPVTASSSNQAPNYVFSSDEAGTVTYGGTCGNGSLSTAVVGNNTVEWNLGIGTYSNCTITVTDEASNASTPLAVTEFIITPVDSAAAKTIEGGVSFQSLP